MSTNKRELQRRIAYEAARILTELRSDNIGHARQKAAAKYGVSKRRLMPSREEIELALREQQRLVRGEQQSDALQQLRRSALNAMQALRQFHPLLVGSVFHGTADANSQVQLHLYAETPEEVLFALSDLQIPWQEKQHAMVFSDGSRQQAPGFHFNADGVGFELTVLPAGNHHRRPLDPLDNQPIRGANLKQLKGLALIDT
ncbi:MAG: hypothetical protein KZQ95_05015 [Candidatus Thiodiazotropha sp. (ex Epidulcina cf. delphinae)]|nr:hypothetical protein [Candidatus Thiodiazotropha sp. (ex Epidulcina cf. delphinae)]